MRSARACWLLVSTIGCVTADKSEATDTDGTESTTGATSTTDTEPTAGNTTSSCIGSLGQCEAPDLCGTIDPGLRPGDDAYAESELCAFAALRDRTPGLLFFQTCHNTGCDSATVLTLADGRVYRDVDSFDAEIGTNMNGTPILCEVVEPSVFEACLDSFDLACRWEEFFPSCDVDARLCECP